MDSEYKQLTSTNREPVPFSLGHLLRAAFPHADILSELVSVEWLVDPTVRSSYLRRPCLRPHAHPRRRSRRRRLRQRGNPGPLPKAGRACTRVLGSGSPDRKRVIAPAQATLSSFTNSLAGQGKTGPVV